ncbi:MAG: peptidyl-prolyl cis-trans isomerase [Alphaproteobacteria bacterium]
MVGSLLREPLVHFALIGVVLYGASEVARAGRDDPRTITVTQSVYEDMAAAFQDGAGRRPTKEELDPLVQTWVSNEVLYREARNLQLDQGDDMIRERIMQKMRVMIGGSIEERDPTAEELEAFYNDHRENYDLPAFFDFSIVRMQVDEAEAKALAAEWNQSGAEPTPQPGQRILSFQVRPRPNVVKMIGEPVTAQLEAAPLGDWQAVETPAGWSILRLEQLDPPRSMTLEQVRGDVIKRWKKWYVQNQGNLAVRNLRAQYTVAYETPPAAVFHGAEEALKPRSNRKLDGGEK